MGEQNLRSNWATAASSPPGGTDFGAGADTQQRNAQLEAELRAMREAFQQLSEAHRVATTGGAVGVAAGATPGLSSAPAEGTSGFTRAAAGEARVPAAASGAMALEDDPEHKGVKRACQRSAMEDDEDRIEQFDETKGALASGLPLTQGATPQQVIDAAKQAALSAKAALGEQRG